MKKIFILYTILTVGFTYNTFSQINNDITVNNQLEKAAVSTYPNPAVTKLNFVFETNNLDLLIVEVFKLTGQPIITIIPNDKQYILDVTSMEEGIYFYKVLYNGKLVKTEKFMVIKG